MRYILAFLPCFVALVSSAQHLLIDAEFKKPLTEGLFTISQLTENRYPIYEDDITDVIELSIRLAKKIDQGQIKENNEESYQAGHSFLNILKQKKGNSMTYFVTFGTNYNNATILMDLVSNQENKKTAQCLLIDFAGYLASSIKKQ